MGESPWAVHETADSVPRLEWSWYEPNAGWQMELGRAVAASACVPGLFAPLCIDGAYKDFQVQLVDGGVYDNQGTVSLLALNCNVLLVSDAAGQLLLESTSAPGLKGLLKYTQHHSIMDRSSCEELILRSTRSVLRSGVPFGKHFEIVYTRLSGSNRSGSKAGGG
jgi:predicted acylesterase/phospholipase RssA